jgi:hypothetical protein
MSGADSEVVAVALPNVPKLSMTSKANVPATFPLVHCYVDLIIRITLHTLEDDLFLSNREHIAVV